MRKPFFLLGLVFSLFTSQFGNAATTKSFVFSLEAGAFLSEIEQRLSTSTFQSNTAITTGFFRARPSIHLGKSIDLDPALGFTVPWQGGYDGAEKSIPIQWDLDLGFNLFHWLKFRTGVGGYHVLYFGGGDAVVLNNGNSTATYYTGGDLLFSTNFTMQAGLALTITSWLGINFDVYALNALSSTRRTFNATATIGINL